MLFFKDILHYPFLQFALLAALLASAACGVLGSYVVARRSSFMVGAVSHSLLGGIGLARYANVVLGLAFLTPMTGSIIASVIASLAITVFTARKSSREDTLLSAVWTAGVALGICFITAIPGYAEDLNSYLFGNILLTTPNNLLMMLVLDLLILPITWLFHTRFLALCFNEETLTLRGISVFRTGLLLNLLTGLAIVLLSQVVGTVMVLALMILPSAAAYRLRHTMPSIMLLSFLFCLISCVSGMALSYTFDWPASATIILIATAIFILAAAFSVMCATMRRRKKPEL